ncbi:ThiF family adenylyltransferase [Bradyrhizobium sp. 1]|uniref:ThiF family adenylyltransferase n=1 Tax=Bradyrhizobium sp. 1 TaxID=241591 RepID=UPI001FFB8196|nr:ThiF family adenylyltransferase [Bradyrhizobium sp. 1]MCK1394302.1 ThiF family adenylyltransferase [Bradyrhizobium sp. 1]
MAIAAGISDRHLRGAEGLADKPLHLAQRVRITMNAVWASSRAGQLLASCLVNLLTRQVGLVSEIEILIPPVTTVIRLANGDFTDGPLEQSLVRIAAWAVNDRVKVYASRAPAMDADITITVGDSASAGKGITLFAAGNGWKAWVGAPEHAPKGIAPDKSNPLGPFLAAALVAGEVFKRGRGLVRGRFLTANGYSLWTGQQSTGWDDLQDGPALTGGQLKPLHIIGAGAVGNGLAYILAYAELADAYAAIIDDDAYDTTSLNRCLLAGHGDVGDPKVEAIETSLKKHDVGIYGFEGTISRYLTAPRTGLRSDLARQASDLAFDLVVSCVDRGGSRQDIQGLAPSSLFGGSTLRLVARSDFYPDRPGAACLSCFNPPEQDGEKLRALEKKLRELSEAQRSVLLREQGIDPAAIEAYLASPKCGTLGEAALLDLATRSPGEFSVGFVSLGAAILLASKLFRQVLFGSPTDGGDVTVLNFLNGGLQNSFLGADDHCHWGCQERRRRISVPCDVCA